MQAALPARLPGGEHRHGAPGNSTLAAALVAVKLGVPLAHVEGGLRSFDLTRPEEANRIVADCFAEPLFVPSEEAAANLAAEWLAADRVHAVGNTMIDALVAAEPRFRAARRLAPGAAGGLLPARDPARSRARGRAAAR